MFGIDFDKITEMLPKLQEQAAQVVKSFEEMKAGQETIIKQNAEILALLKKENENV